MTRRTHARLHANEDGLSRKGLQMKKALVLSMLVAVIAVASLGQVREARAQSVPTRYVLTILDRSGSMGG